MCPDLVLLPQQCHEAVVLLAGAWGERGGTGARQGVVVLTDRSAGNLSGNVMRRKMRVGKKEIPTPANLSSDQMGNYYKFN